jgi:hypothetical protein
VCTRPSSPDTVENPELAKFTNREPIDPGHRRQIGRHHQCGDDCLAA